MKSVNCRNLLIPFRADKQIGNRMNKFLVNMQISPQKG